jgi:hypothetical protein
VEYLVPRNKYQRINQELIERKGERENGKAEV